MNLAFIGGGVMANAIIGGILSKGVASADEIAVCEIVAARREQLEATHNVRACEDCAGAVAGADIVVLAVKPQEFAATAAELATHLTDDQAVMSIMAGVNIDTLSRSLGARAIVRVIPNTPAQIGEGFSVWTATEGVSAPVLEAIDRILSVLGQEVYVAEEKYVDMATAVSSSGPAYVFLVIEAMIDAAVHIGIRREMAMPMVLQTVLGSARYLQAVDKHPAEARNMVTSPGGTTTEALLVLEDAGLRAAFISAIEAAYEKAKQLGG
ncbi:MAG TPA: pyrroline-5-carboxylate reductase [Dehalococcoidia bacterium]|nr:pyrroline-5-carboxylate reductase [Dehalococcoidia bacterium]